MIKLVTGFLTSAFYVENVLLTETSSDAFHKAMVLNVCFICNAVDGAWGDWKDWEPCTATCGIGTQQRVRMCTNPRPLFGGRDCVGGSRESRTCRGMPCPG